MEALTTVVGILLFALVTAFLYVVGLKKSMTQRQDTERLLLYKCEGKVVRYLKRNGTADKKTISKLVENVQGGLFWSRRKAKVTDPDKFSATLIDYMCSQMIIVPDGKNGYKLRKTK